MPYTVLAAFVLATAPPSLTESAPAGAPATASPAIVATANGPDQPLAPAPPQAADPALVAPLPAPEADPDDSGSIVVSGHHETPREDPLEGVNFQSYEAVQAIDVAIVAPVAMGYKHAVPKPVRDGISNLINNLDEPVVALNFLLQLKPGKAAETLGRFAINSTLGVGGLIDVAKKKPFHLPRRYNGLANTLGYYGIGPGPFLFLPGIGPTTLRDLVGRVVDFSIVPRVVGRPLTSPAFSIGKATLGAITDRIDRDSQIRELRDDSDDGYAAIRKDYLERRQAEVDALRGRSKVEPATTPPAPTEARR